MAVDAGAPIDSTDFAGDLDDHETRIVSLEGVTAATGVDVDALQLDIVARLGAVDGSIPGIDGTVNGSTTQTYLQAGSKVGTTSGGGELTVSFGTAFPNGVLSVVVCNGDIAAAAFSVAVVSADDGGFTVRCDSDLVGTPLASTVVRVNYWCIGW